jgi:hypothetical protein
MRLFNTALALLILTALVLKASTVAYAADGGTTPDGAQASQPVFANTVFEPGLTSHQRAGFLKSIYQFTQDSSDSR